MNDFPNYGISECGKVLKCKKSKRSHSKILKPEISKCGYLRLQLTKDNKRIHKFVHNLVAETFIANFENKPQVNHKDGNKLNNNLDNLEFVTCSENALHAYKLKLRKTPNAGLGKIGILNHNSKKVNQYSLEGNFIKTWDSMMDIQRELKILQSKISLVCNFKRNQAYGFIWRFG